MSSLKQMKIVLVIAGMLGFASCSWATTEFVDVVSESYLWNGFLAQSDTVSGINTLGQTWTTGSNVYNISKVRLLIGREQQVAESTLGDFTVTIYDSVAGAALGSTSLSRDSVAGLGIYEIPFAAPVALAPSTQYYFEISATGGDAVTDRYITSHGLGNHLGGVMWFSRGAPYADVDMWFDTYSLVPEPATLSVLLLGALPLFSRKK